MLSLALIAGAAVAQNETTTTAPVPTEAASECVLAAAGHPTVDLTSLTLSNQDYMLQSHATEGYEYVLNVCGGLTFADDTCIEGSSVCQRHKKTAEATDVYGYQGSIALEWDDPQGSYSINSTLVMTMQGTACSATANTTAARTAIFFVCSNKEFLMLESEVPDKCAANFLFFTPAACGSPRYTCYNGSKCVTTEDNSGEFGSFDTCATSCNKTQA
mmetsp:Transcript_10669/g.27427  ORF Transcript_10669/g.27427 Transcript_10669/m.27427 type:complete len:216 (+) Transcript_10669:176-823(+)